MQTEPSRDGSLFFYSITVIYVIESGYHAVRVFVVEAAKKRFCYIVRRKKLQYFETRTAEHAADIFYCIAGFNFFHRRRQP